MRYETSAEPDTIVSNPTNDVLEEIGQLAVDRSTVLSSAIVDILKLPRVRRYFREILDSGLPSDWKYQRFIDFFDFAGRATNACTFEAFLGAEEGGGKLTSHDAEQFLTNGVCEIDFWDREQVLAQTKSSIVSALGRIRHCRHRDGGWGYEIETSNVWGTIHAMWALLKAEDAIGATEDTDEYVQSALRWLWGRQSEWTILVLPPPTDGGVYEMAIAVRALLDAGVERLGDVAYLVERTVINLGQAQNQDGGWDAHVWGRGCTGDVRVWSEVGATSMAVQAIGAWARRGLSKAGKISDSELRDRVDQGLGWLVATQNADGSWNDGSCARGCQRPRGESSITKTCDGLSGVLAGCEFLGRQPPAHVVDDALGWILAREKLLSDAQGRVLGWGFNEASTPDSVGTCIVLETLVKLDRVSVAHLWANAKWLIAAQHKEAGSPEDGKWASGDTFRITLSLIEFYRRIAGTARTQSKAPALCKRPCAEPLIEGAVGAPPADDAQSGRVDRGRPVHAK